MKKTKLVVMVVPDDGSYYLPIPESVAKEVGWKGGDVVKMDIPTHQGLHDFGYITVEKKNV